MQQQQPQPSSNRDYNMHSPTTPSVTVYGSDYATAIGLGMSTNNNMMGSGASRAAGMLLNAPPVLYGHQARAQMQLVPTVALMPPAICWIVPDQQVFIRAPNDDVSRMLELMRQIRDRHNSMLTVELHSNVVLSLHEST